MIDLDRELRALLAEDAHRAPPAPHPGAAVRRTHRRQLLVIGTTLAVIAAVVAGSFAGVSALVRTDPIPAHPDEEFAPGPLEAVSTGSFDFENLTVDVDGNVWWTGPGLSRFDPGSGATRTFTLADDPSFLDIWSISPARRGGVWVVSGSDRAVRRLDGERFVEVRGPAPVASSNGTEWTIDIAEGPDGTLWVSGLEGLFRWDGGSWEPVLAEGAAVDSRAMAVDAGGAVWVIDGWGDGNRVSRFDGTEWTSWTEGGGLSFDFVRTIVAGPTGEVWIGTHNGAARFRDGSWLAYAGWETGIKEVWDIAATQEGGWLAGEGREGVARLEGGEWIRSSAMAGLVAAGASLELAEGNGIVWASTDMGLFRFDGSRWQQEVAQGPVRVAEEITAAAYDDAWLIDWYDGVAPYRLPWGTRYGSDHGLEGDVSSIALAPDGVPWGATDAGLFRFDGTAWRQVASGWHTAIAFGPDGNAWSLGGDYFGGEYVRPVGGPALPGPVPVPLSIGHRDSLAIGPGAEVWVGTLSGWFPAGGGLAHFDGETWKPVDLFHEGTRKVLGVVDIEVTDDGVWVTFKVKGPGHGRELVAIRYQNGAWTEFKADGRIPFDGGGDLASTPDGTLLLATYNGLFAFRDGSWSSVVEGSFDALSVAPDGTIWLDGDDGLFRMRDI